MKMYQQHETSRYVGKKCRWFVNFFLSLLSFFLIQLPVNKCGQTLRHHRRKLDSKQKLWQNFPARISLPLHPALASGVTKSSNGSWVNSTATIAPHEGMTTHGILHLDEGQWPHRDLTRALNLEAGFLVEGHKKIFTHEHGTANVRQTAQILQVAPHQDGTAALLSECTVNRQHVDVHRGTVRFVKGQSFL